MDFAKLQQSYSFLHENIVQASIVGMQVEPNSPLKICIQGLSKHKLNLDYHLVKLEHLQSRWYKDSFLAIFPLLFCSKFRLPHKIFFYQLFCLNCKNTQHHLKNAWYFFSLLTLQYNLLSTWNYYLEAILRIEFFNNNT